MPLEGRYLGRYRLLRLLGSGGMGEVYLAEDARIGQQVAIKVIRAEGIAYPQSESAKEAARLFEREAKAIVRLDHPNILPLYAYGEETLHEKLLTYLVMPYRKEGTLASWLRRRGSTAPLTPQEVAPLLHQAAAALQHAHDQHVLHQDIKPTNFLIRERSDQPERPDLLLSDFGIAKLTSVTASASQSTRGTPTYMAPEQWDGYPVVASDQYALAIMVYELLVGRPPFVGNPGQVMRQHYLTPPPAPNSLGSHLSPAIDAVLLRALAKQPEERFASVTAFARAFQEAVQSEGDFSSPTKASTLREPGKSDIFATLAISEAEAQAGTHRLLTLPGGRYVPVTIPAGTQNGQMIRLENLGEAASDQDEPSALILTITIASSEEPARLTNAENEETVISSGAFTSSTGTAEPAPQELPQEHTRESVSVLDAPSGEELAPPSRATVSPKTTNRRRGLTAILLVGLAVLVVMGSIGFFLFTRSNQQSPYPPYATLTLDDSLSNPSHDYNWPEESDNGGSCAFMAGAYHVNAPQQTDAYHICMASNSNFNDFAYQVELTIVKGDAGGISFRFDTDYTRGNFYVFSIRQDGQYALDLYKNYVPVTPLRSGSSSAINTGLSQANLLAVVATGSTIDLYVNHQRIDGVSDSNYSQGEIGVFAIDLSGPTEVVFRDAKVWTP